MIDLYPTQLRAIGEALRESQDGDQVEIHRQHCALRFRPREDTECTCIPTTLTVGAKA